jgi:hypothetical protein
LGRNAKGGRREETRGRWQEGETQAGHVAVEKGCKIMGKGEESMRKLQPPLERVPE